MHDSSAVIYLNLFFPVIAVRTCRSSRASFSRPASLCAPEDIHRHSTYLYYDLKACTRHQCNFYLLNRAKLYADIVLNVCKYPWQLTDCIPPSGDETA